MYIIDDNATRKNDERYINKKLHKPQQIMIIKAIIEMNCYNDTGKDQKTTSMNISISPAYETDYLTQEKIFLS